MVRPRATGLGRRLQDSEGATGTLQLIAGGEAGLSCADNQRVNNLEHSFNLLVGYIDSYQYRSQQNGVESHAQKRVLN